LGLGRPQKCLGKEHHHRRLLHSFSTVVWASWKNAPGSPATSSRNLRKQR
jgi:hypothetical protein